MITLYFLLQCDANMPSRTINNPIPYVCGKDYGDEGEEKEEKGRIELRVTLLH